ncbi:desi2 [Symbiodinium microadriaticum]|nr:desi2 [Symbiodinium microadriaticum]
MVGNQEGSSEGLVWYLQVQVALLWNQLNVVISQLAQSNQQLCLQQNLILSLQQQLFHRCLQRHADQNLISKLAEKLLEPESDAGPAERRQEDNWDTGSTDAVSPGGSDSDNEDADWIFLRDAAEAPSEGVHEIRSREEGPVAAGVIRANSVTVPPADPEEQEVQSREKKPQLSLSTESCVSNGSAEQHMLETAGGQEEVAAEAPGPQPPTTSLQNDVPAAEATNVMESKNGTVPADAEGQESRSQPGGTSAGKESQASGAAENSLIQPFSEQDRQLQEQAVVPSAGEDEVHGMRNRVFLGIGAHDLLVISPRGKWVQGHFARWAPVRNLVDGTNGLKLRNLSSSSSWKDAQAAAGQRVHLLFQDGLRMYFIKSVKAAKAPACTEASRPVCLNVYDMSQVTALFNKAFGRVAGAFHAAIEVDGLKWSFSNFPDEAMPRCPGVYCTVAQRGKSFESVPLGHTDLGPEAVGAILSKMFQEYTGDTYDLFNRNCCHFADDFSRRLGITSGIPGWVSLRLSAGLAPMAAALQWLFEDDGEYDEYRSVVVYGPFVQEPILPKATFAALLARTSNVCCGTAGEGMRALIMLPA